MGLFGNKEERRAKFEAKIQNKRSQYLEENKIEDLYHDDNKEPMNAIIDMSQNKGVIPQFQNDGVKTVYGEQLVLERQNWMQIRQNDQLIKQNAEIIKLLKELKED